MGRAPELDICSDQVYFAKDDDGGEGIAFALPSLTKLLGMRNVVPVRNALGLMPNRQSTHSELIGKHKPASGT
jgi:hypothetical protein